LKPPIPLQAEIALSRQRPHGHRTRECGELAVAPLERKVAPGRLIVLYSSRAGPQSMANIGFVELACLG
jgi:hypothetical protein